MSRRMSRGEVFEAIDGERDYQERRWGRRRNEDGKLGFDENPHSPGEFLVFMQHYMHKAFAEAATKSGDECVLEVMRKVVTLGVACFEQHGVEGRDVSRGVINGHDGLPA